MESKAVVGFFGGLLGFLVGLELVQLVPSLVWSDPWEVVGETSGEGVPRIERKLNDSWGKPHSLRYEVYGFHGSAFGKIGERNGSYYRIEGCDSIGRPLAD